MNGGQVATRGFLLQTLIALLAVLEDVKQVESLQLEPATDEDKTGFVIEYVGGHKKAVQVKSSVNQIGLPAAKKWAKKLKADIAADEYELSVIGPVSGELAKKSKVDGVAIPIPKSLDVTGMREQACHRVDLYLRKNGMISNSPLLREFIVDGLIGKLSTYSTSGKPLARAELETLFRSWMDAEEQVASDTLQSKYGDGTLTDTDALKEYAAQFDRAALQDSFCRCWNYKQFVKSLGELIEFMNTGKVNGKVLAKRRADFGNERWRTGLSDVYHELRGLRELYSSQVKASAIDEEKCACNSPQPVVDGIESRKRRVVQLLNAILVQASIPQIQGDPSLPGLDSASAAP